MSFKKVITQQVNMTGEDGSILGSSAMDVETTFEVKSLEVTQSGVVANLFRGLSTISDGDLSGETVWAFHGKYNVSIGEGSGESLLAQAEAQIVDLI